MARKVLIVEDESNIAELINLYLKQEGYETMVASFALTWSSWTLCFL